MAWLVVRLSAVAAVFSPRVWLSPLVVWPRVVKRVSPVLVAMWACLVSGSAEVAARCSCGVVCLFLPPAARHAAAAPHRRDCGERP
jgi:hypothetical protein